MMNEEDFYYVIFLRNNTLDKHNKKNKRKIKKELKKEYSMFERYGNWTEEELKEIKSIYSYPL